ncbi:tyrosine/serine phosphatase-like protein [Trichodelitschia bisporula]|uniref:Tyrosine/serine phosphatase-like protein n=1 Tax=Trichodelitschia bisporula TaxID=703511 RepID=A0A6G1IBN6_9PEZI|nr:tyrosine/serine phosphatase-like protein [Trichodelitschia bisporula]
MSPLQTILNFRDVGQTINSFVGMPILQSGRLYRCARPDHASENDRQRLVQEFGITSVIDLRTESEHIQQVEKRQARVGAAESPPEVPFESMHLQFFKINFNGSAYSRALMKQLSWINVIKLVSYMAAGYRVQAIRVLGTNVMRERGLIGLGVDSTDACIKEVREVFDVLAEPANYPLMIHCTQGKDRTGLVVLMVLLLLHVSTAAIHHDYMLSGPELTTERAERVQEIESIGLTAEFADCDEKLVVKMVEHIEQKYGSIEKYLEHAGVTAEMQERVKRNLLETVGTPAPGDLGV